MSQSGTDGRAPGEDDILSAIRRIADEEGAAAPAPQPSPAPVQAAPQGAAQGGSAGMSQQAHQSAGRSTLVLTPTMRVNRQEDDEDGAPFLLTRRVDAGAAAMALEADPAEVEPFAPAMDSPTAAPVSAAAPREAASRVEALQLRAAFGREEQAPASLRLRPAAPEEPGAAPAAAMDAPASVAEEPQLDAPAAGEADPEGPPAWVSAALGARPAEPAAEPSWSTEHAPQAETPAAAPAPDARVGPGGMDAEEDFTFSLTGENAAHPGLLGMTREQLDAMIADQLRKELSGDLGARISQNIRMLVQREVSAEVERVLAERGGM